MSGPSRLTRVRVRGIIVLSLVFAAGALAGAAVAFWKLRSRPAVAASAAAPPEQVIENMKMAGTGVPVLYEALQLTDDQRARIRSIIEASQPKTDSLLRHSWPALRALLDTVKGQVERVLTPEQRARLDAMRRGAAPSMPNGSSKP